jgi:hypothetical protein
LTNRCDGTTPLTGLEIKGDLYVRIKSMAKPKQPLKQR